MPKKEFVSDTIVERDCLKEMQYYEDYFTSDIIYWTEWVSYNVN
ncbi:MAG: hypothetical protein PHI12_08360 [Dehalococcoidales bacterium]|nr:hypothetical protein [Dehalococcoidales bacterium]